MKAPGTTRMSCLSFLSLVSSARWIGLMWLLLRVAAVHAQPALFPENGAQDVNPDTRLRLTFSSAPPLGNQGKITIYDASNDSVVDQLDLSIPPGPRNTRTPAPYDMLSYASIPDTVFTVKNPDTDTSHVYQKNYVGGTAESDAHHFFPVLIDQNVATIVPHNNRLTYDKTYYVQIDAEAFPFPDHSFAGITGTSAWSFRTKHEAPDASASTWVVAADGSADFSTVQGALDATPENSASAKQIFIKNGVYEEIISFKNKQNLTLHGEDRKQVIVRYANNGVFNASGRAAFTISGGTAVNLINFTIQSVGKDENPAQAEALYVRGDKYQVHAVTMLGSGDALQIQANTRVFFSHSSVRGYGDNLLSYGAAFFKSCDLISTYGPHGWPRNPQTNHGDVFLDSTFSLDGTGTSGDGHCELARSPTSGVDFPYAEFVLLNCKLAGIIPEGWGDVGSDASNVHFWEYNSVNASDGTPVDVSKRASWSRQLTMDKDADTIANYSDPTYVLGGWTPELAPVVLTQLPDAVTLPGAGTVELTIDVAAEPEASYQWLKDDQPLAGETNATLKLAAANGGSGTYSVAIENRVGKLVSTKVAVTVTGSAPPPIAGTAAAQGGSGATQNTANGGAGAPSTTAGNSAGRAASSAGGGGSAVNQPAGAVAAAGTSSAGADASRPTSHSGSGCQIGASGTHGVAWLAALTALAALRRGMRRQRLGRLTGKRRWRSSRALALPSSAAVGGRNGPPVHPAACEAAAIGCGRASGIEQRCPRFDRLRTLVPDSR